MLRPGYKYLQTCGQLGHFLGTAHCLGTPSSLQIGNRDMGTRQYTAPTPTTTTRKKVSCAAKSLASLPNQPQPFFWGLASSAATTITPPQQQWGTMAEVVVCLRRKGWAAPQREVLFWHLDPKAPKAPPTKQQQCLKERRKGAPPNNNRGSCLRCSKERRKGAHGHTIYSCRHGGTATYNGRGTRGCRDLYRGDLLPSDTVN